jgi:hypothetical protein
MWKAQMIYGLPEDVPTEISIGILRAVHNERSPFFLADAETVRGVTEVLEECEKDERDEIIIGWVSKRIQQDRNFPNPRDLVALDAFCELDPPVQLGDLLSLTLSAEASSIVDFEACVRLFQLQEGLSREEALSLRKSWGPRVIRGFMHTLMLSNAYGGKTEVPLYHDIPIDRKLLEAWGYVFDEEVEGAIQKSANDILKFQLLFHPEDAPWYVYNFPSRLLENAYGIKIVPQVEESIKDTLLRNRRRAMSPRDMNTIAERFVAAYDILTLDPYNEARLTMFEDEVLPAINEIYGDSSPGEVLLYLLTSDMSVLKNSKVKDIPPSYLWNVVTNYWKRLDAEVRGEMLDEIQKLLENKSYVFPRFQPEAKRTIAERIYDELEAMHAGL